MVIVMLIIYIYYRQEAIRKDWKFSGLAGIDTSAIEPILNWSNKKRLKVLLKLVYHDREGATKTLWSNKKRLKDLCSL